MASYKCIRKCFHKGRIWQTDELFESIEGEKVPQHFEPIKKKADKALDPMVEIKVALSKLDKHNDTHWTANGLPRIEVLQEILGKDIKRSEVTDAYPGFTRDIAPLSELDIDDFMMP